MTAVFHLLQYKPNLPAIILRSRCKVQPIDGASSFKDEFIKLLLFLVGNVYQNGHVADGLRPGAPQHRGYQGGNPQRQDSQDADAHSYLYRIGSNSLGWQCAKYWW